MVYGIQVYYICKLYIQTSELNLVEDDNSKKFR